jgi:hypothetical protein
MSGKKSVVIAFIALAAAVATPALAREPSTQGHPGDSCRAQLRGSLYARGADLKGFASEASGFGQWPTDAVIECWPNFPAQGTF